VKGDKIQEIVVSTFLLHTPRVLVLNSYLSIHCPLPATHIIQRLMHMPSFALFSCPIQAVSGVGNAFECIVVLFVEPQPSGSRTRPGLGCSVKAWTACILAAKHHAGWSCEVSKVLEFVSPCYAAPASLLFLLLLTVLLPAAAPAAAVQVLPTKGAGPRGMYVALGGKLPVKNTAGA
jgi:hypothetical protein